MNQGNDISYVVANSKQQFDDSRKLFEEYANTLDFDLGFQNFKEELENLDKQYNTPGGGLILAYSNNIAVGCVAVRRIEENIAELKRLYVQPAFRQFKIGLKLLEQAIDLAKQSQYHYIRLDTAPNQQKAHKLYHSLGFYEIKPYRFNPVEGTIYMEKKLN
ncbi:MAG: GNAT family N-acetyltransferase [Chitinophagaceae bacterium]